MPTDYDTRLERLEAAQGIGTPQILVVFPGEDQAAKLAEFRRKQGLRDGDSVHVLKVVFPEWPITPK